MSEIHCYVDESGQHTQGDFFSVAAVIVRTIRMRDSFLCKLFDIFSKKLYNYMTELGSNDRAGIK